MGSKYTESQKRACENYLKTVDLIKLSIPKGKKEKYHKAAKAAGFKSFSQYVIHLIENDINKNK